MYRSNKHIGYYNSDIYCAILYFIKYISYLVASPTAHVIVFGVKIEINGIVYLLCWIILPILTIYQYIDCLSYTTS